MAIITMEQKHIKRWLMFALLAVAAAGLPLQAVSDESLLTTEPEFVRISNDETGEPQALQVSIVRYASADGLDNFYVDLVSAVHIGDKSYYQQLNQRFQDYDAVLFELVIPEEENLDRLTKAANETAIDTASADDMAVEASKKSSSKTTGDNRGDEADGIGSEIGFSMISTFQGWMKNALGLSFQLEQVDYSQPNLVHADMTTGEFRASMRDRGESLFSTFAKMWRAGIRESMTRPVTGTEFDLFKAFFSSNRELAMKQVMANEFINMEMLDAALSEGDGSTLLTERNKKALQILDREIANGHQKIAIFYGAAHMPDMGERLINEFELLPTKITWVDAWDLTE